MSYFNDEKHYNAQLLKQIIMREGFDSPTRFIQDLFVMEHTSANKKLNRGSFHQEDIWLIGNALNMDTDEFMRVFFPNMTKV